MKYLKLFENFEDDFHGEYVGIHCSNYDIDVFTGAISDEDITRFPDILNIIKNDYQKASEYLEILEQTDLEDEDSMLDLAFEIEDFFKENNLEWIYVSNNEPLYKYGDNCYNVYFENMNGVYSMSDDLVNDATVYVFDTTKNKPKLTNYE